jgi:hypothetical protein
MLAINNNLCGRLMRAFFQPLILWRCYSGLLLAAAVASCVWVVRFEPDSFWELLWIASIWIALNALILMTATPRQRDAIWWIAISCTIIATVMWTVMGLCDYSPESDNGDQILGISLGFFYITAIYLGAVILMRSIPRGGRWMKLGRVALRITLTALAVVLMALVIVAHVTVSFDHEQLFPAMAIPIVFMTLLILWLPAAASLDALESVETVTHQSTLLANCPSCGKQQQFPQGGARCSGCGLLVKIEFEEPRCECGYLLYNLPGTICPECGRDAAAGVMS